jgi:hypothetical protein
VARYAGLIGLTRPFLMDWDKANAIPDGQEHGRPRRLGLRVASQVVFSRKTSTDRKVVGVSFCRRAFAGRATLQKNCRAPMSGLRLVPTAANARPAFAVYEHGTDAR